MEVKVEKMKTEDWMDLHNGRTDSPSTITPNIIDGPRHDSWDIRLTTNNSQKGSKVPNSIPFGVPHNQRSCGRDERTENDEWTSHSHLIGGESDSHTKDYGCDVWWGRQELRVSWTVAESTQDEG